MKKIAAIVVVCALLVCSFALSSSAGHNRIYTAPFGTPVIDGVAEAKWDNSVWTILDKPFDGKLDSDSTAKVKLMWDASHVYFLAEVIDNNFNAENDIFEFYLDQKNDKKVAYGSDDFHTRFRLSGTTVTGQYSGKNAQTDANFKVTNSGNKYIVEGALKFTIGTPSVGTKMGLEFMYNDGTATADFVEALRWSADTAGGREPQPSDCTTYFGTLVLSQNDSSEGVASPSAPSTPSQSNSSASKPSASKVSSVTSPADSSVKETSSETSATESTASDVVSTEISSVADIASETVSDSSEDEDGPSAVLIIAIVAAVLVVLSVGAVLIVKKKK